MTDQAKKYSQENYMKLFEEINFEFTSQDTPKQNGVNKRGFPTLYSHICIMIAHTGIHENLNNVLWYKIQGNRN